MLASTSDSCLVTSSFLFLLLVFSNTRRVLSACMHQGMPSFSTHPMNITLQVEGDAILSCSVSRSHDRRDFITWQVDPHIYQTKASHSFDEKACVKTSKLMIRNVGKQQVTAVCVLRYLTSISTWETLYSSVGTVSLLHFPSSVEMRCAPQHVKIVHNKGKFSAWCAVPTGHPPVDISWEIEGETSMPRSIARSIVEENGTLFLNQTFQIDSSFNSKTLSCAATSSVFFPDHEIYCTIAPFVVFYRPNVDILPSDIQFLSGASVLHLSCFAEGFPEVDTIVWSCHPKFLLDNCEGENGTRVALSISNNSSNPTYRYDIVKVTCTAANSVGISVEFTEIVIDWWPIANKSALWGTQRPNNPSLSISSCIEPVLNLQPLKILLKDNEIQDLDDQASFLCMVECHGSVVSGYRQVNWFLNNAPVSNNDTFHVRNLGLFAASIMTVSFFGRGATDLNISCDTFMSNLTLRMEISFKVLDDEVLPETQSIFLNHDYLDETAQVSVQATELQSSPFPTAVSVDEVLTWKAKNDKDGDIFGLGRTKFILVAVTGVVVSILFAACLCALCTVFLYRYLQRKDKRSDKLAMSKDSIAHCQHQDKVTNRECEEMTFDQYYEVPIAVPHLTSFSQNDCSSAKCWPSNDMAYDLSGSSMSCSSCGSASLSQSTGANSNSSKHLAEYDSGDYFHSENESLEEVREISSDHLYHN